MQQQFGALLGNQPQIDRFPGMVGGTTSIPEFMAPTEFALKELTAADEERICALIKKAVN
jgi:hypothetical protein